MRSELCKVALEVGDGEKQELQQVAVVPLLRHGGVVFRDVQWIAAMKQLKKWIGKCRGGMRQESREWEHK